MTDLELIDKVTTHLLNQNEKSMTGTQCAYRGRNGRNGLKCAVGCLIPDELYSQNLESFSILKLFESLPDLYKITTNLSLVHQLQHLHDVVPVPKWEISLQTLKDRWVPPTTAVAKLREIDLKKEFNYFDQLQAEFDKDVLGGNYCFNWEI